MLGALVLIAVVGVFAGFGNDRAGAQTQTDLVDFKCYRAVGFNFEAAGRDVLIIDQYGDKEATVVGPNALCNFVEKEDEGTSPFTAAGFSQSDYYTCYEIDQEGFFFDFVEVDNQFNQEKDSQELFVRTANQLCVVSEKNDRGEFLPDAAGGEPPDVKLPHLKCYPASWTDWADFEPIERQLEDQYRETEALVLWPVSLCTSILEWDFDGFSNPTSAGADGEAASKNAEALVCYRIWEPGLEVNLAWTDNELGSSDLVVLWAQTLCVETTKLNND